MSHKRGIYELTISNNVSAMDWLLAIGWSDRSHQSYRSHRASDL